MKDNPRQACDVHRKAAFARIRELTPRLGVTSEAVWDYYKRKANVQSRSELTPKNWAILAAELLGALQHPVLRRTLYQNIQKTRSL